MYWSIASINEEPEVELSNWQIVELSSRLWEGRSRHFNGSVNSWRGEGRFSSEIKTFDPATMTGITRSGRVYKLSGPQGVDSNGNYIYNIWCNRNETYDVKIVDIDSIENTETK